MVERARAHRDRFLVKFEGVENREQAEQIKGTLFVPRDRARELEEGEYWEHDVVGCSVVTVEGNEVGTVSEVIAGPAQDLLQIATPRGDRLVPFVAEIVVGVEVAQGRVVIDPPEGLLE